MSDELFRIRMEDPSGESARSECEIADLYIHLVFSSNYLRSAVEKGEDTAINPPCLMPRR